MPLNGGWPLKRWLLNRGSTVFGFLVVQNETRFLLETGNILNKNESRDLKATTENSEQGFD